VTAAGPTFGGSVWQQGADAARRGEPISACPYPRDIYKWVVWVNGWTWATHQTAREDDEL
jgi:hypothetical protein